jgi:sulfur carrier protein
MKKLEELMKMTIKFINKKDIKEMDYEENLKVEDILKREDIPIETVVVKINGITVTEDEVVNDNDEVEVIKVIYGG